MVVAQENAYEIGYTAADDMLESGAYPTDRLLTEFDITLYAQCAASVLSINVKSPQYTHWKSQFTQGYLARIDRYCVLGDVEIQQWQRNGEFGIANAPECYFELFHQHGGHQEPAHYGFQTQHEMLRENSWIFPPEAYKPVVAFLLNAYHAQDEEATK